MRAPGPEFLESSHAPSGAAREFLAALGARVGHSSAAGTGAGSAYCGRGQSRRVVSGRGLSWIDAAQGVIGPGSIGLLAFDPGRLTAALGGPARGAPASWQMAASHSQPAGPQGRGRRARRRAPSVGGRAAVARAGFGDRRGARGAADERGNHVACRACAPRGAFAARRQALPQRLSPCALLKVAARRHGAYAGGGLRRRRRAGGDARAARQWIGRTDGHQWSARIGRSRQGGARRQQWSDIDCRRRATRRKPLSRTPCRSERATERRANRARGGSARSSSRLRIGRVRRALRPVHRVRH